MIPNYKYMDSTIINAAGLVFVFIFLMVRIAISAIPQPSIDGYNVYYGNLQNHPNVSDGKGTAGEAVNYTRNVSQFDFSGLSGRTRLVNAAEWLQIKANASLFNEYCEYHALRYAPWLINVKYLKYKLILTFPLFNF